MTNKISLRYQVKYFIVLIGLLFSSFISVTAQSNKLGIVSDDPNQSKITDLVEKGNLLASLNTDSAISKYIAACKLAEKNEDVDLELEILGVATSNLLNNLRFSGAYQIAKKAIGIAQENNRPKAIINAEVSIALIITVRGDYNDAITMLNKCIIESEKIQDTLSLSLVYNALSSVYLSCDSVERATFYQSKSLKITELLNDSVSLVVEYINISRAYGRIKNYDAIENYLIKAEIIAEKLEEIAEYDGQLYQIYIALGNLYYTKGNLNKAIAYYDKGLVLGDRIAPIPNQILRLIIQAKKTFKKGNSKQAIELLAEAEKFSRFNLPNDKQIEIEELYIEIYLSHNDYKNAFEHQRVIYTLYQRNIKKLNMAQISEFENLAKIEQKDKELELANREKIVEENKLKIIGYTSGALILLLLIIAFLTYRFINQKQKIKELLHQKALDEIDFVNSHQTRAPVARILGLTELFNTDDITDEINPYIINKVQDSAKELVDILRQITLKAYQQNQKKIDAFKKKK